MRPKLNDTGLYSLNPPITFKEGRRIDPGPTREEFEKSADVVRAYALAAYQLLYAVGLANCNGGKWKTSLAFHDYGGGFSNFVQAVGKDDIGPVYVREQTPEALYRSVVQIENAYTLGWRRTDNRACCCLAERNNCVCEISFKCPVHGKQCYGSHD